MRRYSSRDDRWNSLETRRFFKVRRLCGGHAVGKIELQAWVNVSLEQVKKSMGKSTLFSLLVKLCGANVFLQIRLKKKKIREKKEVFVRFVSLHCLTFLHVSKFQ